MGSEEQSTEIRERPNSFEVHQNAKGEYAYTVKMYHDGTDQGAWDALALARKIFASLKVQYEGENDDEYTELALSLVREANASQPVPVDPHVPYVGSRTATVDKRVADRMKAEGIILEQALALSLDREKEERKP